MKKNSNILSASAVERIQSIEIRIINLHQEIKDMYEHLWDMSDQVYKILEFTCKKSELKPKQVVKPKLKTAPKSSSKRKTK